VELTYETQKLKKTTTFPEAIFIAIRRIHFSNNFSKYLAAIFVLVFLSLALIINLCCSILVQHLMSLLTMPFLHVLCSLKYMMFFFTLFHENTISWDSGAALAG